MVCFAPKETWLLQQKPFTHVSCRISLVLSSKDAAKTEKVKTILALMKFWQLKQFLSFKLMEQVQTGNLTDEIYPLKSNQRTVRGFLQFKNW